MRISSSARDQAISDLDEADDSRRRSGLSFFQSPTIEDLKHQIAHEDVAFALTMR